jgi:hypothetical protein
MSDRGKQGDRQNSVQAVFSAVALVLKHAPLTSLRSLGTRLERNIESKWTGRLAVISALIIIISTLAGVVTYSKTLFKYAFSPSDTCYMLDPKTETKARDGWSRHCASGRITFIKWHDPEQYSATQYDQPSSTYKWPNDRPNRVAQLFSTDEVPNGVWFEQDLDWVKGDTQDWNYYSHKYLAISNATNTVVGGKIGILLRRFDLDWPQCVSSSSQRPLFEIYFNNDIVEGLAKGEAQYLFLRVANIPCGQDPGTNLLTLGPFKKWHQIVSAKKD